MSQNAAEQVPNAIEYSWQYCERYGCGTHQEQLGVGPVHHVDGNDGHDGGGHDGIDDEGGDSLLVAFVE